MRRPSRAPVFFVVLALGAGLAGSAAADPAAPTAAPEAAPAPAAAPETAPAPVPAPSGLAVVALPGATAVAWPLARAVYADPSLRPSAVDEPHARILCGEPAPADAAPDLRDLADSVAALHDDDAPTRILLADLAHRYSLRALVVVRTDAGHATARLFLPDTRTFDAATYAPDDLAGLSWASAVRSLGRSLGVAPPSPAPALATHAAPKKEEGHGKQFYESGWFWGAVGAAVLIGGAAFLATRDTSPSTIHLQVQVPH